MSTWALRSLDPLSQLHEPSLAAQASPNHRDGPRFDPDANPTVAIPVVTFSMAIADDCGERFLTGAVPRSRIATSGPSGTSQGGQPPCVTCSSAHGTTLYSVGVGGSSRSVLCGPCAGRTFHSCQPAARVVQRLGSSIGSSHGRTASIRDRPFFRPGIRSVGADRASVMRCHRSPPTAVDCCCCCPGCCQALWLWWRKPVRWRWCCCQYCCQLASQRRALDARDRLAQRCDRRAG